MTKARARRNWLKKLNDMSTARLLGLLDRLRKTVYYQPLCSCGSRWCDFEQQEVDTSVEEQQMKDIKEVLGTRDHYPRGKLGRQLRQKEKQNR